MKISKQPVDSQWWYEDETQLLFRFTEVALQGSAAQMAMRHDLKAEKIAVHAVEIAMAAIEELKKL